jgi:hypothetical protein
MILIGLVPLLLFGVLSILVANSMIQDRTLAFHQQLLEQRKQYINLVMSDVESLIANLAGNEEIHAALSNDAPDVAYDRLVTQSRIGYILSGYSNLKGLVSIDIFTASGNQFHVGETLQTADIDISLKKRLEAEAVSSGKYVHWSGVESNINRNSQYPRVVTQTRKARVRSSSSVTILPCSARSWLAFPLKMDTPWCLTARCALSTIRIGTSLARWCRKASPDNSPPMPGHLYRGSTAATKW